MKLVWGWQPLNINLYSFRGYLVWISVSAPICLIITYNYYQRVPCLCVLAIVLRLSLPLPPAGMSSTRLQ